MRQRPILSAQHLTLGYGSHLVTENLSFELFEGEITCLMGPNGVGKSTLIKALIGSNPPIKGDIILNGKNLNHFSRGSLSRQLSVVLTDRIISGNMRVKDLVALGRLPFTGWWGHLRTNDRMVIENVLQATHIEYIKESKISELSDGQLQKVMIARALAQDGKIMILDEPTAHLDLINRFEIMYLLRKLAKESNKAILVVTHDLEIALETADQLWIMSCETPLTCGSPEELMISGEINQLIPGKKWGINSNTGKIELNLPFQYPEVIGPDILKIWIQSAIKKLHPLSLPPHLIIKAAQKPFSIEVQIGSINQAFSSLSEFTAYLKNNFKKNS
ncbi:MAG: ABC transporter ATP-binding protein [Cyclobacteriaceae bacterium]